MQYIGTTTTAAERSVEDDTFILYIVFLPFINLRFIC